MTSHVRKLKQSVMLASGAGVRVAVLDSGIDPAFPALTENRGQSFILEDIGQGLVVREVPVSVRTDASGHGSCVQSCLLAAAPDAIVDHYRILDEFNNCPSRLLCLALDHVIEKRYNIVNLSLGTRNENVVPWLVTIVKRAYETGTCLVAASSNIGNSLFPGRFTYSISVSACEGDGPLALAFHPGKVVEFSGWGINVPIAVDAGHIVRVSGTSYASGFVAGICARIIETLGHSQPLDVKLTLRNLAQAADPDLRTAGG
jgi:subtilisin family serine protease